MRHFILAVTLAASLPAQSARPDFSGVWERPYVPDMTRNGKDQQGSGELPFTAWGAEQWKNYNAETFDYTGHCLPQGLTRSMNSPFPIQIVQTASTFVVLYEAWNVFHVAPIGNRGAVPADAKGFPQNMYPTWMGTSIAHWDGDTMVVETTGFNGKTNLDTVGHPHSDQMSVTERYTLTDPKHIRYEVILNDPKTYTKPVTNVRTFTLRPDWEVMEYSCMENNKDLLDGHLK